MKGTPMSERLLTRKQLAEFLTDHGYPIGRGTIQKMCSPGINTGPPTAAMWGRFPMHRPSEALEWARNRLRPIVREAAE